MFLFEYELSHSRRWSLMLYYLNAVIKYIKEKRLIIKYIATALGKAKIDSNYKGEMYRYVFMDKRQKKFKADHDIILTQKKLHHIRSFKVLYRTTQLFFSGCLFVLFRAKMQYILF